MKIKFLLKTLREFSKVVLSITIILSLTLSPLASYLLVPIGPKNASALFCQTSNGGSPGAPGVRPGGVALNQAATFLANMTDYSGAYYDSTLDRIVFIGKTNTQIPKFNKDDLAVAIKTVIFNNTIPYVSIDPQAGDTNNTQPMDVRFSQGLEDTKFGQIILDADYKMKQYSHGYNADGSVLVSSVPGYKSFWKSYQDYGMTDTLNGSRWWITPKLVSLKKDDLTQSFIFDQVKMQILTQPTKDGNSTQWNNAARDFAQQQTDLYDEFAKESPSYLQTKQLSQIVAVIKWIKDAGIVYNFEWAKSYQPEYNPTPRTKTRLTTPWVTQGNLNSQITGGADFSTANTYNPDTGEAVALKAASQAISTNKEDVHWTFTRNGQTYDSVAVEAEAFRSVGAYSTTTSDFSTSITDDLTLQLNRSYNSYSSAQDGIGKGWSILPASLTQTYWGPGSVVGCPNEGFGYKKVALTFPDGSRESFEYIYCGGQYTATDPAFHSKFFIRPDGSYYARTPDQTEYSFDNTLKLTQIKDKNDNKITYSYDGSGKLNQIKDDNNHVLTVSYNNNLISQVTDWGGRTTSYAYDPTGNLTAVTDPKGGMTRYAYDSSNRLSTVTNRSNQLILTNTYNQDGRLLTQKDASGKIVTYSYDNTTNTVSSSDNQGRAGKTIFDNKVRVLKEQDALNFAREYTYGTEYKPLTVKDKKGSTTTFSYDTNGNILSQKDPAGITVKYEYDAKNNVTKKTDDRYISSTSGNKVTSFSYDPKGNLIQMVEGGKATNYTYNAKGQLINSADPLNKLSLYTRDSFNNVLTLTDPQQNLTTYTYDTLGRLTQVKDPNNKITSFTYDNNNNLLTTSNSLGTTTNLYNAENKLTKMTLPNNSSTQMTYNTSQSLSGLTDAMTNLSSYGYDQYQNITSKQDALNRTTQFGYDKLNHLIQNTTPLGKVSKWEYDPNGNISKRIDGNNQTTSYEYDIRNKLSKITYPNASTVVYSYDNRGNLLTMVDPSGSTTYTYDSFDRLTSVKDPNNATIKYEYDLANNLTKLIYPDNKTVAYTYDNANRLISINDWNNSQTAYSYNANNTLASRTYPNGIKTNYSYDNANNLTAVAHLQGSITLAQYNYTRNNLGSITNVTESNVFSAPASPPSSPAAYSIYNEKLETGWEDWSWNSTNNFNDGHPNTGAKNISWKVNAGYAAIRFQNPVGFTTTGYDSIQFALRGTQSGQLVQVQLNDSAGQPTSVPYQITTVPSTTGYSVITVPLGTLNGQNKRISSFLIQDRTGVAQPVMYIDDVRFIESQMTPITGFTGQYWNFTAGSNPVIPTTTPNLTRQDAVINFDWGGGSPGAGINADNFVARWSKTASMVAGTYRFKVATDDGVRLLIDGQLVIDKWIDQGTMTYTVDKTLTAGNHTIIMEYYEKGGGAVATFGVEALTAGGKGFTGEYWNSGTGSTPSIPSTTPNLTRIDNSIDFDWSGGSPDPIINIDHFVVRWTKTTNFDGGNYQFKTTGDDGVRLFIDGEKVIDGWRDQGSTAYSVYKNLTAGNHTVVMEYYENGGGALAKLQYNQVSTPVSEGTSFSYDPLLRILTANYPNSYSFTYTYDKVGNRLSSKNNTVLTNYIFNNDNQLTSQGTTNYTYDNKGNRVSTTLINATRTYGFDFENRLSIATNSTTGISTQYTYNGNGTRLSDKVNNTPVTQYVTDVSGDLTKVLQAKNISSNTQNYYVYGTGLVSQGDTDPLSRKYFLDDGLGNIRYVLDVGTNSLQSYSYEPFGNLTFQGGAASNFQYKGEQLDTNTGFYFMRARYYDPSTGSFISKDPVAGTLIDPQSQNGYSFVNNDPINHADPSGKWLETAWDVANLGYDIYTFDACDPWSYVNTGFDIVAIALPVVPGGLTKLGKTGKIIEKAPEAIQDAKRFNADQDALIQLGKESERKGGVTPEQADILKDWAKEYDVPFRGPESHPNRDFGSNEHIHLGPVDHILVK